MTSLTRTEKFILLNLFALFGFLLTSLLGFSLLPFWSVALWTGLIAGGSQDLTRPKRPFWIGCGFVLVFGILGTYWLQGIWVAPSQDDTINHLGYLEAVLSSKSALLGHILRPGADWFGESAYHFYPSGAHALVALWIYPLQGVLAWPQLFRAFSIIVLAGLPGLLWASSFRAFPKLSLSLRTFLVVIASTQAVFPLGAFGEGGFSRILAVAVFTPLWFKILSGTQRFKEGFIWTAVVAPTLFFIHPSLIPLVAVITLFLPMRALKGAIVGSAFGGAIFYFVLHSAQQEVTQPGFLEALLTNVHSDLAGWFDRLKGPFHYWMSDSLGFGKFLSPKNYFIYLALGLAIARKLPVKVLLFFMLPFAMAALALISHPWPQHFGVIFYHSVKRIAELTPLLGFTLGAYGAVWFFNWFTSHYPSRRKWLAIGVSALSVLFILAFIPKSKVLIDSYHQLYQSPKVETVKALQHTLLQLRPTDRLLIDRHSWDVIRFVIPQTAYTLRPECGEVGASSEYCNARRNAPYEKIEKNFSVWWLPEKESPSDAEQIELAPEVHLIQIFKARHP